MERMTADQFGRPVPPTLRKHFLASRGCESVIVALERRPLDKSAREAVRLIKLVCPAAVCPDCCGQSCSECGGSGWYSLFQFDSLTEEQERKFRTFRTGRR